MSVSQFLARAIEQRQTLAMKSYIPLGDISSDVDIVEFTNLNQESPDTQKTIVIDDPDSPVFQGPVIFIYDAFNDKEPYFHPPVMNPSAVDLQLALDAGLSDQEDSHHVFLESLHVIRDKDIYFASNLMFEGVVLPDFGNAVPIILQTGS